MAADRGHESGSGGGRESSRARPSYRRARSAVGLRDCGVCARCGLDTHALRLAIDFYAALRKRLQRKDYTGFAMLPVEAEFARAIGENARRWPGELWEANHIVAIVEGGAADDPDNIETLCARCHKLHTKALAVRNAKAKRRREKFGGALCGSEPVRTVRRSWPKRRFGKQSFASVAGFGTGKRRWPKRKLLSRNKIAR